MPKKKLNSTKDVTKNFDEIDEIKKVIRGIVNILGLVKLNHMKEETVYEGQRVYQIINKITEKWSIEK